MTHLVTLPVLLPLLAGCVLLLGAGWSDGARRAVALTATVALLPVALLLLERVADGTHLVYALGDWAPPFGIVLVADRLAVAMLLLTAVVAMASLVHAGAGDDTMHLNLAVLGLSTIQHGHHVFGGKGADSFRFSHLRITASGSSSN